MAAAKKQKPTIGQRLSQKKKEVTKSVKKTAKQAKKKAEEFNMKNFSLSTGNVVAQICAITGAAVLGAWAVGAIASVTGMNVLVVGAIFVAVGAFAAYKIQENHPGACSLV